MIFWLVFAALTLGVIAFLGAPLVIGKEPASGGRDPADILKRRKSEIDAARAAGLIDEDAAEAAFAEAGRVALTDAETAVADAGVWRAGRFLALALVGAAPIAVVAIYLQLGSPGLASGAGDATDPDQSRAAAIAEMTPEDRQAAIEAMVDGLAARLAEDPENIEGLRMLARSQAALRRFQEAAQTYRSIFALTAGAEEDWRNFAQLLIAQSPEGVFPADAEFVRALNEVDARSPGDPFVLFYRGGAARENGTPERAAELWRALLAQMPEGEPARETLQALIEELPVAADDAPGE